MLSVRQANTDKLTPTLPVLHKCKQGAQAKQLKKCCLPAQIQSLRRPGCLQAVWHPTHTGQPSSWVSLHTSTHPSQARERSNPLRQAGSALGHNLCRALLEVICVRLLLPPVQGLALG